MRLKAGGVVLCGTSTSGNRLYFDCPPVRSASTGGGRDRMCWRSELCRSICVSVGWSASGGGSGRGGGIRGREDDSTGGRDCGLRVSRINAARSSLRDKKWDPHIRSPRCHVTRGLRIGFRNAKRNPARSPQMYGTNHHAWSPLLSLSNSILFGVNGSLREAFGWVGWSLGTSFGGRGWDGDVDPVNIIASCKASVAAARAAVSPVDGTGKGTGPTTSSPSLSTSVRLACGKSAMAVVKRR